ncbi:MAG: hypothetical protein M0R03_23300 [Novosphingobium sp.]|nr:hypothetical protein [Novosphingobium sp.]
MPKCAKCGKEIKSLIEDRVQRAYYKFIGKDNLEFRDYDTIISQEFYCPECDKKLFDDEDQASDFLDGAL